MKKRLVKGIKFFLKKKKATNSQSIVASNIRILMKMKNKSELSIR